jgi:hypothetical protein
LGHEIRTILKRKEDDDGSSSLSLKSSDLERGAEAAGTKKAVACLLPCWIKAGGRASGATKFNSTASRRRSGCHCLKNTSNRLSSSTLTNDEDDAGEEEEKKWAELRPIVCPETRCLS